MEHARDAGTPSVLEVNAPLVEEQSRYRGLRDEAGARQIARRAHCAARHVIAVSREVAVHAEALRGSSAGVHVLPNGVDPARFDVERRGDVSEASVRIGFVGTLKPWHGVESLVEAFDRLSSELPETELVIIGDGPERAALEQRAERCRGRVRFEGEVAPEEIPAHLATLDIAVAPYADPANFYFSPLKLFEYMAAGCAVVAADVGQISDVLAHETSALLYPPGDVRARTSALARLVRDPGARERLGREARRVVDEHRRA